MWAIIGLGNPGRRYARTRHNVGRVFVGRLAVEWGVEFRKKKRARARVAETQRERERLVLVQPTTYMNESGLAVRDILQGYRLEPRQMLLVFDDLDIPLGQIRVRQEGSAGSHNGVRSVIEVLGTEAFPRLRVGIGPLADRKQAVSFVLSPFEPEELAGLEEGLRKARQALTLILEGEIERAMAMFNQKEKASRGEGHLPE